MFEALTKTIPIIMFISIGFWLQRRALVDEHTMHVLKKGIIYFALPAVLFLAFKDMELRKEYAAVAVITFIMMVLFYLGGLLVNKLLRMDSLITPFLTTAFSFGLLGIPLFGGVYGLENVGTISVLGIGNELFIWFVYLTLIKQKLNNERFGIETVKNFLKSPIILAIIAGLVINLLNFNVWIESNVLLKGIELTLEGMSKMTTPLILLIIGYGIKLESAYVKASIKYLLIRNVVILSIGYGIKVFLFPVVIGETSHLFDMAYYTYLILPPPFSLAIFTSEYSTEENTALVNNTVVLSTILCVVLFVIGVVVTGA